MKTETAECLECTTGAMAGAIPGTLANGERCDACKVYASDREAALAITNADLLKACKAFVGSYSEDGRLYNRPNLIAQAKAAIAEAEGGAHD